MVREFVLSERDVKTAKTRGVELVCDTCGEPLLVRERIKTTHSRFGRTKRRHVRCLASVRR